MRQSTISLVKATLSAIHLSKAHRLLAPVTGGCGIIFMLHRVSPDPVQDFEPNRILRVTPEFLEDVISGTRSAGFDIVSLDEARERLVSGRAGQQPFACFTFDDGYRDNLEHAYPVLKRHGVPATIYVPGHYPAGGADLWWITLEQIFRQCDEVKMRIAGHDRTYSCATASAKNAAFDHAYWWLRAIPEEQVRQVVRDVAERLSIDPARTAQELIMSWDEVETLARDPLITIGGHTREHRALAELSVEECVREMSEGVRILEERLGTECRHFAYPYGDGTSAGEREFQIAEKLGFDTAVTTRKGVIHPGHRESLMSLPRLSLNGDFQDMRYVDVLMSGLPFALLDTTAGLRSVARRALALGDHGAGRRSDGRSPALR